MVKEKNMCSMVKRWSHFLLALLVVFGALILPATAAAVTVGKLAPDFTLQSTAGKSISLSQFRGKKMVLIEFYGVNFGAT